MLGVRSEVWVRYLVTRTGTANCLNATFGYNTKGRVIEPRRKQDRQFFDNDKLDALFTYLFITTLLQLSTCFEHHNAHHQEIELY